MTIRCCTIVAFVLLVPQSGSAQRITTAAASRVPADTARPVAAFGTRAGIGALGFVAGVAAGLGVAAATGPHDCGGCDDPGLGEAIVGAALGGAIGASIGASIPEIGTRCTRSARIGRSLAGSLLGTVAGIALGFGTGQVLVTWPVGTILGASAMLTGC